MSLMNETTSLRPEVSHETHSRKMTVLYIMHSDQEQKSDSYSSREHGFFRVLQIPSGLR